MALPYRGVAFAFSVTLVSQADTDVFKETTTLAAGDIQVSKDGAQYANLATFPPAERDLASGADSGTLYVQLTATEMDAGEVSVLFRDAAGSEWQSVLVVIQTIPATGVLADLKAILGTALTETAGQIAAGFKKLFNVATPVLTAESVNQTGDAYAEAAAVHVHAQTLLDRIGAFTGTGVNTVLGFLKAVMSKAASTPSDVGGTFSAATYSLEAIRDQGDAAWGPGTGASSVTYTVTVGGLAADGVYCRMTSDAAGLVNITAGTTNALGQVTFLHNLASGTTVYIWRSKAGVEFTNPDTEVIP